MPNLDVFQSEYQLAAGYNNAAGLSTIEGTVATANDYPRAFGPVRCYSSYDPGEIVVRGNGTYTFNGFASVRWTWGLVSRAQEAYIRDTFCGGGYAGEVTVRTTTDDSPDTFANYNAVLLAPRHAELSFIGRRIENYAITLSRLVAL